MLDFPDLDKRGGVNFQLRRALSYTTLAAAMKWEPIPIARSGQDAETESKDP